MLIILKYKYLWHTYTCVYTVVWFHTFVFSTHTSDSGMIILSWQAAIRSVIVLICPSLPPEHTHTHVYTYCVVFPGVLLAESKHGVVFLSVGCLSFESLKVIKEQFQVVSSSVRRFFRPRRDIFIRQAPPHDLRRCTLTLLLLSPLCCNEKQREILSSAANNSILGPHGILLWGFDGHQPGCRIHCTVLSWRLCYILD